MNTLFPFHYTGPIRGTFRLAWCLVKTAFVNACLLAVYTRVRAPGDEVSFAPPVPGQRPSASYLLGLTAANNRMEADALPWYRWLKKWALRNDARICERALSYDILDRKIR